MSTSDHTSQYFYFFSHQRKHLQTVKQKMKLTNLFIHTKSLSSVGDFGHDLGQFCFLHSKEREREGVVSYVWEIGERPFSCPWGLSMVDMEDYTGTKIALLPCVVSALLVLHYYRLVLLSWWTIEGFISTFCTECLYGLFLPSSRCRKIFSIRFLEEPSQNEEV